MAGSFPTWDTMRALEAEIEAARVRIADAWDEGYYAAERAAPMPAVYDGLRPPGNPYRDEPSAGRPASGATPAVTCDSDHFCYRCNASIDELPAGGAGAAQTTTHPFVPSHRAADLACYKWFGPADNGRYCQLTADDPIHQTTTPADHIAILDGEVEKP
jgi:hypothetical protein